MNKTSIALLAGIALLIGLTGTVAAQQDTTLRLPVRVRVSVASGRSRTERQSGNEPAGHDHIIGTLVRVSRDTVVVLPAGKDVPMAIPSARVNTIEISRGRRSEASRGALVGFLVGGVGGAIAAIIHCSGSCEENQGAFGDEAGLAIIGGGALAGTGIGWLVGSMFHQEGWQPVSLRRIHVAFAPVSSHRMSLAVSVPFHLGSPH
jgi:hypothetical protein